MGKRPESMTHVNALNLAAQFILRNPDVLSRFHDDLAARAAQLGQEISDEEVVAANRNLENALDWSDRLLFLFKVTGDWGLPDDPYIP